MMEIRIGRTSIDTCIHYIRRELWRQFPGADAEKELSPLVWYIETGRASTEFIRKLFAAKPFMIARKLHQGGAEDVVLDRVCNYIGFARTRL